MKESYNMLGILWCFNHWFYMNLKKNIDVKKNSAISSAALQDHLLKKFNFNFDLNF